MDMMSDGPLDINLGSRQNLTQAHSYTKSFDEIKRSSSILAGNSASLLRSIYLNEASRLSLSPFTGMSNEISSDITFVSPDKYCKDQSHSNVTPSYLLSMRQCDSSIASSSIRTKSSPTLTGHHPVIVYQQQDENVLSEYQCFVRQQIEFFEADIIDVETNAKGRNNPISLGQVGIRCRHCAALPPKYRSRGAMYYPTKLNLIYQAAQNMTTIHLLTRCKNVTESIRHEFITLRKCKSGTGGGKLYWNEGAQMNGVREVNDCLRFALK
jgi:hypothetical protein